MSRDASERIALSEIDSNQLVCVLSFKSSFVLLQLVADSKDMTIFESNNTELERQSFQSIPRLSWFRQ